MYHYTECGLTNVWLENGYITKKTAYGKATAVDDAVSLHNVLAMELTEKKGKITGLKKKMLLSSASSTTCRAMLRCWT